MSKFLVVFVLCYWSLVAFLVIDARTNEGYLERLDRPKRYLSFYNITRFYLKINFKANMVPWNQLFAQAIGYKMTWDDPPDSFHAYHHFSRRAVYDQIELLLDRNGLNGHQCVRRAICEMKMISKPHAIYHRILKIIFRNKTAATERWHNITEEDCRTSISQCPLSVLHVSRYTDLI